MRLVAKRVEKEHVQAAQLRNRSLRHFAVVGQIRGIFKTETVDFFLAMHHGHRLESQSENVERLAINEMDIQPRHMSFEFALFGSKA